MVKKIDWTIEIKISKLMKQTTILIEIRMKWTRMSETNAPLVYLTRSPLCNNKTKIKN